MKMTPREKLENGCGFQDNSWKSSLCIKGSLCSECKNNLDYFNQGREEGINEIKLYLDCDWSMYSKETQNIIRDIKKKLNHKI